MDNETEDMTEGLLKVLHHAWSGGFSTKSDFARTNATPVAVAASIGFITVETMPNRFGRSWLVSPMGLSFLHSNIGFNCIEGEIIDDTDLESIACKGNA